ncbi:signal peptidase II [soil metagenome]
MKKANLWILLSAALLFAIDRIAKMWALGLSTEWVVNNYLSFGLAFNRGINWGLFNGAGPVAFTLLTIAIGIVIAGLGIITYGAILQRKPIMGYLLILVGAVSNFIDRIIYGGVIDFIVLNYGHWSWPAFNIADALILLGIALVIKNSWQE